MVNYAINYVNRVLSIFSDNDGLRKREDGEGVYNIKLYTYPAS